MLLCCIVNIQLCTEDLQNKCHALNEVKIKGYTCVQTELKAFHSTPLFKRVLKTFLFRVAFNDKFVYHYFKSVLFLICDVAVSVTL